MDELAADVEAEAGAADAAGQVGVEPEELLEDPGLLGGWDAEATVADADPYTVARPQKGHANVPAVRGVLDRVFDEVREDSAQLVGVGCDGWQRVRRLDGERHGVRRVRTQRVDDPGRERGRVAALDRQRHLPRIEPARPEDVVDDAREPIRLVRDHVEQTGAL